MSYILGDNIGFRETFEIELKEFTLNIDPVIYFDTSEIIDIVNTGNISTKEATFNSMILDNINHYFKYYLPKYMSVFGNSQSNSQIINLNAKLYIGVNDFGEITGVPFVGNLPSIYLESMLSSIEYFINVPSGDIKKLIAAIKINIIELIKDLEYIDNSIENIIKDFFEKKNKYEQEYFESVKLRHIWKTKLDYYFTKIHDYANKKEYRILVSEFIRNSPDYDISKHKHLCDILDSDEHIYISKEGSDICTRKLDKQDIVYWITECKDTIVKKIKSEKPPKPVYINYSSNIHAIHLGLLSNLRNKFVKNNKNINYYLIEIQLPCNYEEPIYFKNLESDKWMQRTRTLINGVPSCY